MLDDNQTRNRVTGTDPNQRGGVGRGMIALIAAVLVFGLLFMWAPWSGSRVAGNTAPGTTTGSSTARPPSPMAPNTAPAPNGPAAPTTR
jgi:hypothetical protein